MNEIESGSKSTKGTFAAKYALDGFTWEAQVAQMVTTYRHAIEESSSQNGHTGTETVSAAGTQEPSHDMQAGIDVGGAGHE